jgi:hypothetical protein
MSAERKAIGKASARLNVENSLAGNTATRKVAYGFHLRPL